MLAALLGLTREWIQTIAIAVGVLVTAGSAAVAALEYRLKAKAERAESDTKLARLFADLIPLADGYPDARLPEGLAVALIEEGVLTREDFEVDPATRRSKAAAMLEGAMVHSPVGLATMLATLQAVAELGARHEVLTRPADVAITTLDHHKEDKASASAWELANKTVQTASRRRVRREPKEAEDE
jgi:hypothetical protein